MKTRAWERGRTALLSFRPAAAMAAGVVLLVVLSACASSPPTQWYELRSTPPPRSAPVAAAADSAVWEMSPRAALPGALDRDNLMVARGNSGLEPLPGQRWAEPLRDSVPRLLLADLQRLRGESRVWAAPAPPGVLPQRRLSLVIEQLQVLADLRTLRLVALASWQDLGAAPVAPPQPQRIELDVTVDGPSADAIAAAHRLALWQLAERLTAGPRQP